MDGDPQRNHQLREAARRSPWTALANAVARISRSEDESDPDRSELHLIISAFEEALSSRTLLRDTADAFESLGRLTGRAESEIVWQRDDGGEEGTTRWAFRSAPSTTWDASARGALRQLRELRRVLWLEEMEANRGALGDDGG
jgi:hypothetical protein